MRTHARTHAHTNACMHAPEADHVMANVLETFRIFKHFLGPGVALPPGEAAVLGVDGGGQGGGKEHVAAVASTGQVREETGHDKMGAPNTGVGVEAARMGEAKQSSGLEEAGVVGQADGAGGEGSGAGAEEGGALESKKVKESAGSDGCLRRDPLTPEELAPLSLTMADFLEVP